MKFSLAVDSSKGTITAYAPFSKVEEQADGTLYVEGVATAEMIDSHGEVVLHDASVKAFANWTDSMSKATDGLSMGNIREMHQPVAAGKAVLWRQDDANKANVIGVMVVDPDAAEKVKKRVYTGFSIGGDHAEYGTVKIGDTTVPAITAYRLAEVSLVDRPACPAATYSLVKRDDTPAPAVETAPEDNPADETPGEETPAQDQPTAPTGDQPAGDPVPKATEAPAPESPAEDDEALELAREPELADGDSALVLMRNDSRLPVGWYVTRRGGASEFVPWAKGKVKKGAVEAIASAETAIAALKSMLVEVAALPGSPDMWTLGDILGAMQYALSAAYGCKMAADEEAADAAEAAGSISLLSVPSQSKIEKAMASTGSSMLALAKSTESMFRSLQEQAKAKDDATAGALAEVLKRLDTLTAAVNALPAPAKGVLRPVAKRLGAGDDTGGPSGESVNPSPDQLQRAVEVLEATGQLPDHVRQSVRLALAATAVNRGA